MADLKFYDVIERPVITENSMSVLDEKKYKKAVVKLTADSKDIEIFMGM